MAKKTTHSVVASLLQDTIRRVPIFASGTYNRQDPTHYEKGAIEFMLGDNLFEIKTNDCTWGIEIAIFIKALNPIYRHENLEDIPRNQRRPLMINKEIGGFYISREQKYQNGRWVHYDEVIYRHRNRGILKLLRAFNQANEPIVYDYHEDPMGCLADYI